MKNTPHVGVAILAVTRGAVLGVPTPGAAQVSPPPTDSLYVADATDDSVKRFDAQTGPFLGTFIHGRRGLVRAIRVASDCLECANG